MDRGRQTIDEDYRSLLRRQQPLPGVVLVFTAGKPTLLAVPIEGPMAALGRDDVGGLPLPDERVSREHAEIEYDGARWTIRDKNSRNGTFLDGQRVHGEIQLENPRVLRIGQSIFFFSTDVRRYDGATVEVEPGRVMGPTLREAIDRVTRAAGAGECLLLTGESGSGKELAARSFHEAGSHASGPFVPVNCAAIPEGVAERLLFGARKGAFSGATADVDGYVQAADGGTLFLDELGELDLAVQAKLLRVLETREVMPLGASRGRAVTINVCAATNRDLRNDVAERRFREDLYFRIGRPEVRLPPLRERFEELPYLVERELHKVRAGLAPHGKLIESCLLRPWPGNLRELLGEIRRAGQDAVAAGANHVVPDHLGPTAGMRFGQAIPPISLDATAPDDDVQGNAVAPPREAVEKALADHAGNVAAAARSLGLHRTQLYRFIKRYGIVPPRQA